MVVGSSGRRIRCSLRSRFQRLRDRRQGRQGSEQRVRPAASEVAGTRCPLHNVAFIRNVQPLTIRRNKQSVSDAVLEKEKDKPIGQVFDSRFSWAALLDAVADVYLGVCISPNVTRIPTKNLGSSLSGQSLLVLVW